jgi:hypothetical protein
MIMFVYVRADHVHVDTQYLLRGCEALGFPGRETRFATSCRIDRPPCWCTALYGFCCSC